MDEIVAWVQRSWGYIVPWILFLGTATGWIRNAIAAEKDRRALRNSELEREKLELEVKRLRNSPEVLADRRAIYDRLWRVVEQLTATGDPTKDQILELRDIRHAAEFRFPAEIVEGIRGLIVRADDLQAAKRYMRLGHESIGEEGWKKLAHDEDDAFRAIDDYRCRLLEIFRPHLSP